MQRTAIIKGAVPFVVAIALLTGCGGGDVISPPAAEQVEQPTFQTRPDDLADARQLDALIERDTAGLEPTSASARGDLLPEALAALAALDDAPKVLSRLSIYDDSVYFAFLDGGRAGRSITAVYRSPDDFYISDPSFNDSPTYAIDVIQPDVPQRLIEAIESRFANARVTGLDLDPGSSYDFGLVWNIDVEDARGSLATVYADVDGSIVAVDLNT